MKLYTLEFTQTLPVTIDQAWDFLSNPQNLALITPPYMDFRIVSGIITNGVYPGQLISYTVKPLAGIPLRWLTEITHVQPPVYFTDEQRSGPYRFWQHQHFLREVPGGIEMRDRVHYALPLGFIGSIINKAFIRKRLLSVFSFRKQALEQMFGSAPK